MEYKLKPNNDTKDGSQNLQVSSFLDEWIARRKESTASINRIQDRLNSRIIKKPSFDHLEHTDKSRRHIAFVFVWGYIVIVAVIILGVPLYNWLAVNQAEGLKLEQVLAQVGALIGSPLGFVVGYYFKEDNRRQ